MEAVVQNVALNLFHIGGAFVEQSMTDLVVQLWAPTDGHYPEIAYQTAFACNVGLQIVAVVRFALTWVLRALRRVGSLVRRAARCRKLKLAFVQQDFG